MYFKVSFDRETGSQLPSRRIQEKNLFPQKIDIQGLF